MRAGSTTHRSVESSCERIEKGPSVSVARVRKCRDEPRNVEVWLGFTKRRNLWRGCSDTAESMANGDGISAVADTRSADVSKGILRVPQTSEVKKSAGKVRPIPGWMIRVEPNCLSDPRVRLLAATHERKELPHRTNGAVIVRIEE